MPGQSRRTKLRTSKEAGSCRQPWLRPDRELHLEVPDHGGSCWYKFIHSFIQLPSMHLQHPSTPMYPSFHPPTIHPPLCTHPSTHPPIHPPIHSSIHLSILPSILPTIHNSPTPMHPSSHPLIHSPIHPFTLSSGQPACLPQQLMTGHFISIG